MLKYFALLFLTGLIVLIRPDTTSGEVRALRFYAPPKELRYFALGESLTVSDSLWLRVIQDFDYCEGKARHQACRDGWVYHMIDLVTDLDSHFHMPYIMGATILSVLVDDVDGAAKIFAKGLAVYPTDWSLAYRAGSHAMTEEKNPEKAARYFRQAAQNGAPFWVNSLAARMYTKAGERQIARQMLQQVHDEVKDEKQRQFLELRMKQMDEEDRALGLDESH
jgi:tetratricopeptide (TPR) repeat protein